MISALGVGQKGTSPQHVTRAQNVFSVSPLEKTEITFSAREPAKPSKRLWKRQSLSLNEASSGKIVADRGIDIAILSEQCRNYNNGKWYKDNLGTAAI